MAWTLQAEVTADALVAAEQLHALSESYLEATPTIHALEVEQIDAALEAVVGFFASGACEGVKAVRVELSGQASVLQDAARTVGADQVTIRLIVTEYVDPASDGETTVDEGPTPLDPAQVEAPVEQHYPF